MTKKPKRQKAIKRLNLSDHTLDINIRKTTENRSIYISASFCRVEIKSDEDDDEVIPAKEEYAKAHFER